MSTDKQGTGMRSYEWLLFQVENLMMRDHDSWAIAQKESTLNSRGRQYRLTGGGGGGVKGGGKGKHNAAAAQVQARLCLSTDILRNGKTNGGDNVQLHTAGPAMPARWCWLPVQS